MIRKFLGICFLFVLLAEIAAANVEPNQTAPGFEAKDLRTANDPKATPIRLEDFRAKENGKWVVLEWFNSKCPFVEKHYKSQNMQQLQKKYMDKGVVWLTVNSTAKTHKNYVDEKESISIAKQWNTTPTALILDTDGKIGKAYGAKTTPHMFVIDPTGKVVYAGAIDSNESKDPKVIGDSTNYVAAALDAGMSGKPIKPNATRAYGCNVKYE